MFHPKIIFRIIGLLLYVEAIFLLGCVPVALYYDEPVMRPLLISIATMVGVGALFTYLCGGTERNISRKDGYIVVTLCWIIFSLFGSLPYMLTGYIPTFTDAFYETMSGFSTTGATIHRMLNSTSGVTHTLVRLCCPVVFLSLWLIWLSVARTASQARK